jgi:hypothetical protein
MKIEISRIYYIYICIIFISIIMYYTKPGPTTVSVIFDMYILSITLYFLVKSRFRMGRLGIISIIFIFLYFLGYFSRYYFFSEYYAYIDTYEFLRSSRFIVYMACFVICSTITKRVSNDMLIGFSQFSLIFRFICFMFLMSYFISFIIGVERPVLYSENNYEVPALLCFYIFHELRVIKSGRGKSNFYTLCASSVAILSLSKSAILELAYSLFLRQLAYEKNNKLGYIKLIVVIFLAMAAVFLVFSLRQVDSEQVDRLKFFDEFWGVFVNFSLIEFVFGKGIANELPFSSCITLKFWAQELSSNYLYCNSTTFHSYFMRIVYDTGLLGLFLNFLVWLYFLTHRFGLYLSIAIFGIISICSLSVTGFSNSIVIWPLFMLCAVQDSRTENCTKVNQ